MQNSLTLTPNKRLARHLQKQFCITTAKQNEDAWHSAKILPLKTWLINCWQECPDPRVLLNTLQERLLWQKIITENLGEKFISLTKLAINAHESINGWQLEDINYPTNEIENFVIFQSIYQNFKNYCETKNLVTSSQLPTLLIPYVQNFNLEKITFAGFDEYNPQLQNLITVIKETGCEILELDPNNYQNSIQKRLGFNKIKQEIITSAKWAKQILDRNSNNSIGIVVPNLVELRPEISQVFSEILDDDKAINISTGIPLGNSPIINSVLELLSLSEPFSLETFSRFLLSPYITGAETEKSERAFFNLQLKQSNYFQLTVSDIKQLAKKYTKNIPLLIKTLQKWQEFFSQLQNKILFPSEWMQIFAQTLQILGWPGENNLTDLESTAIKYFTKLLQDIAATNLITGKIPYKKTLQILHDFIIHTTLQPEHEIDAPINIFGTLEAAGINFDYLWIMGLDQESWPPAPHPNPFISFEIQKKFLIPHASAERELHFCEMLIKRYKRSAKEIIFSHIKQIEDRIIEPSSLIANIPEILIDDLNLAKTITWEQKIHRSQKLETLDIDPAPKLTPNETIHGSSRLIELQSLCPFQAFMEFRLATKEPIKLEPGISKINRGIIVHGALEHFWQKVRTQQNLCQLEPTQLQKAINDSLEYSLKKLELPPSLYKLEKQCLIPLLTGLLEIEKSRQPFEVIATEKTIQINLSSIQIKIRIDRIDQLTNGNTLLIDYKTGKNLPSIFDWFGPRPKNIQLPLYSVALRSIQGLALVQINVGSLKFKEISLEELLFGLRTIGVAENNLRSNITWDELIEHWRSILTKLASDFAAGEASPTPLSPQVCKKCSFGPVCRVSCL
ncbi:MAG: hypothetical protein ACD_19C00018G0001 [uncultured bacterium]|nr:MAG: hypothetical protein ACD_19C00018G0001 [uncultured bacterium]